MNKMQTCAYRKHEGGNEGQKETEIDAWKKVKTTSTQSYAGKYTGSLTPTLMVALKMRSRLILSSSHPLAFTCSLIPNTTMRISQEAGAQSPSTSAKKDSIQQSPTS